MITLLLLSKESHHLLDSFSLFRKIPLKNYSKIEGLDLELPCLTEQKNVMCVWLKNGTVITPTSKYQFASSSNSGDCSLTIQNLSFPKDNIRWECQVPSLSDQVTESWPSTEIIVLVKPTEPYIKYDNLSDSIVADQLSHLQCQTSNGNPLPTIEWFLNDINISQYSKTMMIDRETRTITSTLNFVFKKTDNGSKLTCRNVHQTGQQNALQTLNVQYKPFVSVKHKMYTIYEGNDLEIDCHVEANPEARIFWKPTGKIDESKYRVRNNKLLLQNISRVLNEKIFQCSAVNDIDPPQLININYPRKNITVGDDIQFECNFAGNPEPKIRWSFTDAITKNLHHLKSSDENPRILVIKNATYMNEGCCFDEFLESKYKPFLYLSGDYYCHGINYNSILNKEITVPSSKFAINVVGKPLFLNEHKTVIGYRGLDTKLEQSFCSDPHPDKVYWIYGSNRMDVEPMIANVNEDPLINQYMEGFHIKTGKLLKIDSSSPNPTCFRVALIISNTDNEDIRDYVLVVHNKFGKNEGTVSLIVNYPLSVAAVIAFALIILVIIVAITIGIVLLRRRSNSERLDPELEEKSEVQGCDNY
ncbi:kin of IRRE-like protein 1-like protein [Sarcoptes scabiei]|uniref:Kin of IRRE-like protein 1-like protein n=1 Tax=Sarcoptes scabiei TaxID=52283 RepID=A0A132AIX2_SARSC|nr:kin of IRRE-like protein 1-like protein [Sarcoptes scabiei]